MCWSRCRSFCIVNIRGRHCIPPFRDHHSIVTESPLAVDQGVDLRLAVRSDPYRACFRHEDYSTAPHANEYIHECESQPSPKLRASCQRQRLAFPCLRSIQRTRAAHRIAHGGTHTPHFAPMASLVLSPSRAQIKPTPAMTAASSDAKSMFVAGSPSVNAVSAADTATRIAATPAPVVFQFLFFRFISGPLS